MNRSLLIEKIKVIRQGLYDAGEFYFAATLDRAVSFLSFDAIEDCESAIVVLSSLEKVESYFNDRYRGNDSQVLRNTTGEICKMVLDKCPEYAMK